MAQQFLPNQSALGHRIRFDPGAVVHDCRCRSSNVLEQGYEQEDKPAVYISSARVGASCPRTWLFVSQTMIRLCRRQRCSELSGASIPTSRFGLIGSIPDVVSMTVVDRQRAHDAARRVWRALALLIAFIRYLRVCSRDYRGSTRIAESACAFALGATRRSVVTMVMSRGIGLTAMGVAVGGVMAWIVTRAMQTLLTGVPPATR